VLTILNPEKYSFLPIPYTAEFQPQEVGNNSNNNAVFQSIISLVCTCNGI